MNNVKILECTLRDGSYTVSDQFTAEDTAFIAKALDEIGFEYIEVGPGIGLNAKIKSEIMPASEDIEYIRAARNAVKNGKIGMFFIPGIGRLEDMKMARDEGLDFIRIGINITDFNNAFKYLEYAKSLGFITTVNFMKSYAVSAQEFARVAHEAYKNGAGIVYLVDSAGGMLPKDVEAYVKYAKDVSPDLKLGFHGHNNLALAMGNSLTAIENGAEFIDSTIRGMGRSSGNAVTEKLLLILDRMGYKHGFDLDKLLELSEKTILPYLVNKFETSTDYIVGYSQFHSSYLNSIYKMSKRYNIDPNKLIVEYSKVDIVTMDEGKLEEIAKTIRTDKINNSYFGITSEIKYKESQEEQLKVLKSKFIELKSKYNHLIFFNLSKAYEPRDSMKSSPVIHTVNNLVFGSAEFGDRIDDCREVISYLKDVVDGFLVDKRIFDKVDGEAFLSGSHIEGKVQYYNDAAMFAKSISNYLKNIKRKSPELKTLYIDVYQEVMDSLKVIPGDLGLTTVADIESADIAVLGRTHTTKDTIDKCKSLRCILLTVPGRLDSSISEDSSIQLIRIDFEREIFTEIVESISYRNLFDYKYGIRNIDGKAYCSGGFIGTKGTVVVDDINNISRVYGVSNGDGRIVYKQNE
ncbi:MAG: hypothetical protein N3B21_01805 [Clostridia bacterium]|nr:hypothetical protein [Clostridia bacterium]